MDAQLAIVMANQAQIAPGHIVIDPFVGSGSLLIAAAHFGGICLYNFCIFYAIVEILN